MDNIMRLLVISLCGLVAGAPLGRLLQRRRDAFEVYAREFARDYSPYSLHSPYSPHSPHSPYMFAAFPLHAPVPVLRVLTRAPLALQPAPSGRPASYAGPYSEPARDYLQPARSYAEPPRPYAAAEPEYEASSSSYARPAPAPAYYRRLRRPAPPALFDYAAEYAEPAPAPQRSPLAYAIAPYEPVAYSASQEAAPTVLYARPSPSGGFTYRRLPGAGASAPTPKRSPPPAPLSEREKDPPFIVKIHKYRIVKDDSI